MTAPTREVRVSVRGKSFWLGESPYRFRAVRRPPEERRPPSSSSARAYRELAAANAAGYTVISLPPPDESYIREAIGSGLHFLLELELRELSALAAQSSRERRHSVRDLVARLRSFVRPWEGSHALLGVVIPAPVIAPRRTRAAAAMCTIGDSLAAALHEEDPNLLAGWQAPHERYGICPPEFDFLLVDYPHRVLEQFGHAIMASHAAVGDRPLVARSRALPAAEPTGGADAGRWLDTALRSGAAGTVADTHAHAHADADAQRELAATNRRTVRDLEVRWPSLSVVINAYNAESTIDECLGHCDRLEYPELEVIVVDDGSTDATPDIVRAHPRARLVRVGHRGLAAGRNVGFQAATGELIAYLDADAYPTPEWPWYLALAAVGEGVAGCGGPNVPPADDSAAAKIVARSPGGPMPQLIAPDRAEHVPGCNMAYWRRPLEQLGGFDPVIAGAEDIEFEWRLLASGWAIAYHPAALVWHHRRPGLRPYLRQQRLYGRGQAILERRCPHRFPPGHRLRSAIVRVGLAVRRAGPSGSPPEVTGDRGHPVSYISLAPREPAALRLAHQWGMPGSLLLALTAPLGLVRRALATPAAMATVCMGALFAIDVAHAGHTARRVERSLVFRARIATFRLLRPLAFRWGHLRGRREMRAASRQWPPPPSQAGPTAQGEHRALSTPPAG